MKIKEALLRIDGKILSCKQKEENEMQGVYCCDLLSWAMSNINENDLWITIQTNLNILAVASLTEAALIVIPEGISIDEELIKTAEEKDVMLVASPLTAYEICKAL